MKRASFPVFLSVILLVLSTAIAADVPYLTGRVTDNAGILSGQSRQALLLPVGVEVDLIR